MVRPILVLLRWKVRAHFFMLDRLFRPVQLFWDSSARWKWYEALFVGGFVVGVTLHEYLLAMASLTLCAFSVISRAVHARTFSYARKVLTVIGILLAFLFFSYVCVQEKGDREWSWISPLVRGAVVPRKAIALDTPAPTFPPDYRKLEPAASSPELGVIEKRLEDMETDIAPKPKPPIGPPFDAEVEFRIFTPFHENDEMTPFWFGQFGPQSCVLRPVHAALFVRLTNLQPQKIMVVAYTLSFQRTELTRFDTTSGRIFSITKKGSVRPSTASGNELQFDQGPGIGSWVGFKAREADPSVSIPVEGSFLDVELRRQGNYLQPNEPLRGWVFLEYPGVGPYGAHLTLRLTDALEHTFEIPLKDPLGHVNGDALPRRLIERPTVNLSNCEMQYGN